MAILTVSFDMYQDPSALVPFYILLIGIVALAGTLLLMANINNKNVSSKVTVFGVFVSIAFIVIGMFGLSGGSKEEIYSQEYETLEKSLLLNKVSEAKVNVKQLSDHKFVIKQDGIKHITSTVSGKTVTNTPRTTTGKAYLRVVDYIKDQQKKEPTIKIKITPSLSNTTASYETPRGKFKVVCYADNQSQHKSKDSTKIIKY